MNKEIINALIYILLRDSFTIADMERIIGEVKTGVKQDSPFLSLCSSHMVETLNNSILQCYDNMCNTPDDDVKLVIDFSGNNRTTLAMCVDCRRRHPEAVLQ